MKFFLLTLLLLFSLSVQAHLAPIKIAIIDTGTDLTHPYLYKNIWTNQGESGFDSYGQARATNGVDDDHNGYIDDVHGWNFAQQNKNLADQDGHGTHIAGVIKEATTKIKAEFIIIKYYNTSSDPGQYNDSFLNSLKYAIQVNANIINISGGGRRFSSEELAVFKQAAEKKIIVVAAAGNKSTDSNDFLFYPAAYKLPNILSVVATDESGKKLATSNINKDKLNIFEYGEKIYSCLPGNNFGYKTGSSQAAAAVTGRIARQFYKFKKIKQASLSNFINTTDL